jgi:hypothetical protein
MDEHIDKDVLTVKANAHEGGFVTPGDENELTCQRVIKG